MNGHRKRRFKEQVKPIDIGRVDQRSLFGQPSDPIGRVNVLHELEAAYVQAAQGSSVSVNVSGDEGTGKSYVASHYMSTLSIRGVQVMSAACSEGKRSNRYAPIMHAIGQGLEQLWCEDAETIATVQDTATRAEAVTMIINLIKVKK